jgi:hypothetical protein
MQPAHILRTPRSQTAAQMGFKRKAPIDRNPFAHKAYQSVSWLPLSGLARLDKAEVAGSSPASSIE